MSTIIDNGPVEYEGALKCHVCGTDFIARTEDLGVDGFKKDPNTYWFDGTATSVQKYYAWCPHSCDVIFIADDQIPELAKRKAVEGR